MTGRPDLSVLPLDLQIAYAQPADTAEPVGMHTHMHPTVPVEQLELEVESAAAAFKRWLQAQEPPEWMDVA